MNTRRVIYQNDCPVSSEQLRSLFADAWPEKGSDGDYTAILSRSLGHVCAYLKEALVGFVYVAWDGGCHAFLLDPTVRTDMQRQGIGSELVRRAADLARSQGVEWLHVDFEPQLEEFYRKCGFKETRAGLIRLNDRTS
jgi:GNAT superfamily N-acetyltransferase